MNGVGRTSILISCYLRYAELFQDTLEALDYFVERRTPTDRSWISVSQLRYLTYFNTLMNMDGEIPNAFPLKIHRIILNGIPNFDNRGGCMPGIILCFWLMRGVEIYQSGRLIYSVMCESDKCHAEDAVVFMDTENISFQIPEHHYLQLEKDIQVIFE